MMFRVGQRVVCVNAGTLGEYYGYWEEGAAPIEGSIYTIARYCLCPVSGYPIVHLVEICRGSEAKALWGGDIGYGAERFRPIVGRKTDISALRAMLVPGTKIRETVE